MSADNHEMLIMEWALLRVWRQSAANWSGSGLMIRKKGTPSEVSDCRKRICIDLLKTRKPADKVYKALNHPLLR